MIAVLGEYAYINGGEVSQLDADGKPVKSYPSNGNDGKRPNGTAVPLRRGREWHELPNGTYEIFVFGGTNTVNTYDDVFFLSSPGFVRTQVIYGAKSIRRFHTCAVVGRRHMLSVGGSDGQTGWSWVDPWPQGLGLFDMTDWVWKTDYDASAKDYETSGVITDWYKNK
ncbi:hypothetical protein CSHISOI_04626 [Colletotrichum shisoi]|uniref:Kelch repeat-containing protein n=1 Tax=Colletotrichum shisoi TaxID=2078593 RepID=A0A5Q4BV59_9PEZI|nr:hypothetical protein CSHISOI_04626 [Colletotrichum shisoi]